MSGRSGHQRSSRAVLAVGLLVVAASAIGTVGLASATPAGDDPSGAAPITTGGPAGAALATNGTAPATAPANETGFVSGRVSDAANNDIENATVVIMNASSGFEANTTTNANGEYTIEVPAGNYMAVARKPGFASVTCENVTVEPNATTSQNFVLREILFPDSISVSPTSATTTVGGTLTYTVTVRDQNDDLLRGAQVNASVDDPRIEFTERPRKWTDADGEVTFSVTSEVPASGQLTFTAINYSGGPNPTTATATAARSGSGAETVTLGGGAVSGTVSDSAGDPVEAVVYAERFVLPTDASRYSPLSRADQVRFTLEPTAGVTAGAVDDPSDAFVLARQRWNGSAWVDVTAATVDRSALSAYTFPDSAFPGVDVDGGFALVDVAGSPNSSGAGYALDPIPAVDTETGAASTNYSVRAVETSAGGHDTTATAGAAVHTGSTDETDLALPAPPEPASLRVSNLSAPASVAAGSTVEVSATISNDGAATASGTVDLRAGSAVLDTTSRTVGAGASQRVTFAVDAAALGPGSHTLAVVTSDDDANTTVRVVEPPSIRLDGLTAPATATVGDTVTISATVTNTGGDGDATVELRVDADSDGTVESSETRDARTLTVAAGATETVRLNLSTAGLSPGTHTLGVAAGGDTATAALDLAAPCSLPAAAASYDRDGDCAISLTEFGNASTAFADGDISLTELGAVSSAFADG